MRWVAALSLVLVALIVVVVEFASRERRPARPRVEASPVEADPAPVVARQWPAPGRFDPEVAPAPTDRGGVAQVIGRVLLPEDVDVIGDIEVVADDGVRTRDARVKE